MDAMGDPTSYLQLQPGTRVLASDGAEVGTVEHVLADDGTDIFDGLVVETRSGPGGHCFVDATQVAELREEAVILTLDSEAAARLPEPSENPAAVSARPGDTEPDGLQGKLRRAWDYLSGNY